MFASRIRYANKGATGFRADRPITDEEIQRYAPSVMASQAHESRSARYGYCSTKDVLDGLRSNGFQPYQVVQTRCRDEGKKEFTKHLVRLRHASAVAGTEVPEIVMINSHDGTSSYQLMSGVFRMICENGLIAGDIGNDIKVRHNAHVVDNVIEGCTRILDDVQLTMSHVEQFKSILLSKDEQRVFANSALQLKYDEGTSPIEAADLLDVRRRGDWSNDLWTVFNRAQESLIRGGVRGLNANGRRISTRAVTGVNENVRLNKALWTLAEQMAALKVAA
jgi:hypothetical protein